MKRESITPFGECPCLRPAFELMQKFDGGSSWDDVPLNLFGQDTTKRTIKPGISLIHFTIWKFILIHLTKLSLEGTHNHSKML